MRSAARVSPSTPMVRRSTGRGRGGALGPAGSTAHSCPCPSPTTGEAVGDSDYVSYNVLCAGHANTISLPSTALTEHLRSYTQLSIKTQLYPATRLSSTDHVQ